MKDAFLVFLLVLATLLAGGYIVLAIKLLTAATDPDDGEDVGCFLLIVGGVVAAIVGSILYTVGTNVGVHMPQDWK